MSEAVVGGHEGPAERRSVISRGVPQGILGGGAVILGIVGLAIPTIQPTVPMYLDAIAGLLLGFSLLVAGSNLASSYARLFARAEAASEGGGQMTGATVDIFLGGSIVILAVLAILSVSSPALIPILVILIGVGLVQSGAATVRLTNLESAVLGQPQSVSRRIMEELAFATASVRVVAGVAVLILGILGLTAANPFPLTLVAMIVAGAALILNTTSLSGRIVGTMTR